MSDETDRMPLPEAHVARRQLQMVLLLDSSGSMAGEKIASLNYAIRSALSELRQVASENPEVDMRLSAVRFADEATWHIEEPTPVDEIEWEDISAGGETAMGQALALVAGMFNSERFSGRQLPPVVLLVTDGFATDDFGSAFAAFLENPAAAHATRLAIAIGDTADIETLESFVDRENSGIAPLQARNAPELVRYIKWATTAPVKATSSPTNAPKRTESLALEANQLQHDDSAIVW
ncbi:MAG: VWA domain-containing protein [Sulfitobacter sp.]